MASEFSTYFRSLFQATRQYLNVLIARTDIDEASAERLVRVQLAKWYCDDISDDVMLEINIFIPDEATAVREVFERLGAEYVLVPAIDVTNATAISEVALELDCDLVIAEDVDAAVEEKLNDDLVLVSDDVEAVLHATEIHMKGFDVPWSFAFPSKNQPWTNFYILPELSALWQELSASAQSGPDVNEVMRSLVADAIPSMCFNRDRAEFYRQQDRWAARNEIERQDFRFEYTTAMNLFYLTLYGAVDQVVALIVNHFGLAVPEKDQGALYGVFERERKKVAGMDDIFSDGAFWDMYKIPRLMRHKAAHRGPVTPTTVYFGDGEFTDAELDETAEEHGFFDDLRFLEKTVALPEAIRSDIINMARHKAKLKRMGKPLTHCVYLKERDAATGFFYNPDLAGDLKKFLDFLDRVLAIVKPWNKSGTPPPSATT